MKNTVRTLANRLRGLSMQARMLSGAIVVIALVAVVHVSNMLSSTELPPNDLLATAESGASGTTTIHNAATGEPITFNTILQSDNPFMSRSQYERRWLIATMNVLGEAISSMSGIERATVVIDEPKSQVGLGRSNTRASASVTIVPTEPLTSNTIDAIAEMVAGAHANLPVEQVRIIDTSTGTVHRARTEDELVIARSQESMRKREHMIREEIAQALAHIPDTSIVVRESRAAHEQSHVRINAIVGVPRSYFIQHYQSAQSHSRDGRRPLDLEAFITAETTRIRSHIEPLLALHDESNALAGAVAVNVLPDVLTASRAQLHQPQAASMPAAHDDALSTASLSQILLYAFGATSLLLLVLLARRSVMHNQRKINNVERSEDETDNTSIPAARASAHHPRLRLARNSVPFSFLQISDARDILALIQDEHPQTIALIVYNQPHHKAAAILEQLPRAKQIDVARRVANMHKPNAAAVRELEAELESRLSERRHESAVA